MNIISICVVAVLTAIISLVIKKHNPEIAFAIVICGCVIILLHIILNLNVVKETVNSILSVASIDVSYIAILFKVMGICFVTEFACDCCIDAGQRALSNNISMAGKIIVLITAMPLYQDILDTVLSLTGGT